LVIAGLPPFLGEAVSSMTKPSKKTSNSSNTITQQQRLLQYLQEHGRIDTFTARSVLDIVSPAARIFELKKQGHNIIIYYRTINGHSKVSEYVLLASKTI